MTYRRFNVFSLSFLDCITCGLGAIILLFVLINAKSAAQRQTNERDLRAETRRLETEVGRGQRHLTTLRQALAETQTQVRATQAMARKIMPVLEAKQTEVADRDKETLAQKTHVNKLKTDLKALEEELKRLEGGARADDALGRRLRAFPGDGDRHYLTDLKMGGKRILILVDASASMLDQTIVGVIRHRNLTEVQRRQAPKWQRVVATIDWLSTQLPLDSRFQVHAFNETAWPLIEGTQGTWLDAGKVTHLNQAVKQIQALAPKGGTSLLNAFKSINTLKPPPDNILLLTDGLPTMGAGRPWLKRVSGKKRLDLYKKAVAALPAPVPVNVILFPMEGDPIAADAFWRLARRSRGSFFCPSKDWP
jgi:hypothetical protein